jgi:hypothetical protein
MKWEFNMAKMMKAYAAFEKKAPAAKKKEAKSGMHMMFGKPMKNSAMKKTVKKKVKPSKKGMM